MRRYGEASFLPEKENFEYKEQGIMEDEDQYDYSDVLRRNKKKKIVSALLGLVAVGGASWAGIEKYSGNEDGSAQSEAKENTDLERYNDYLVSFSGEVDSIKQAISMENELNSYEKKIAQNEAMTEFLLDKDNLDKLDEMIDLSVDGGDPKILSSKLYRVLSEAGAQDFFYDRLLEKGEYKEFINPNNSMEGSSIYSDLREHHFSTLAKSFLPNSSEISNEEIDPRLFARNVKSIDKNIERNPQWSAQEKNIEFKQVLDNAKVREVLQSDQFSLDLAQAYSFIKISIDSKNNGDERSNADIIREIAQQQEFFSDVNILSEETQNFIFVAGHDTRLSDDISRNAPRYQKIGEDFGVKNIVGFSEASGMEENFKKTISESKGETTIFVDAHSSQNFFQLNNKEKVTAKEFAEVLLQREKAGEGLSDMTIILGGCDTYGLAENILAEIERQSKKKKFKEMELPNIITSVTGSANVAQDSFRDSFSEAVDDEGIQGSKKLTISDFINLSAPKAYGKGADISVFIGKKGGYDVVAEDKKDVDYYTV